MSLLSNHLLLVVVFHVVVILHIDLAAPVQYSALGRLQLALQDHPCNLEQSRDAFPYLPKTCCCSRIQNPNEGSNSGAGFSNPLYTVICTEIEEVPPRLPHGTKKLTLEGTNICKLKDESFNKTQLSQMTSLSILDDIALHTIGNNAFSDHKLLTSIVIDNVKNLVYISGSAFSGLQNLKIITIKGSGLSYVQGFNDFGNRKGNHLSIFFSRNKLLTKIPTNAFHQIKRPLILNITNNPALEKVEGYAFNGSRVTIIDLSFNSALTELSPNAFVGSNDLQSLSLQSSPVKTLPSEGLRSLKKLDVLNVPSMARFPNSLHLPNLRSAVLTYPYHCCVLNKKYGFGEIFQEDKDPNEGRVEIDCVTGQETLSNMSGFGDVNDLIPSPNITSFVEEVIYHDEIIELTNDTNFFELFNFSGLFGNDRDWDVDDFGNDNFYNNEEENSNWHANDVPFNDVEQLPEKSVLETTISPLDLNTETTPRSVKAINKCYRAANGEIEMLIHQSTFSCAPEPDAFNPCEDLLGDLSLVVVSFVVAILAVLGNIVVVVTLLFVAFDRSRTEQCQLTVSKFLILNLAIGDFCMGVYILTLSIVGVKSKGSYYEIGVEWQTLGGCDAIGFLSIFSSQLSIYTLSVISLERWYAIRYAIQLDKRMTLNIAGVIMAFGWAYSIIAAMLPLVGVNSYQKTAICLPMNAENNFDMAYIGIILTLDKIGFALVVGCYIWMYIMVRTTKDDQNKNKQSCFDFLKITKTNHKTKAKQRNGSYGIMDKRNSDARVAKKMAVLVFTDFACFFPIYFFSLFGLIGLPLVTISTAKILLVLCYPFNACCNPFLYALLTRSFRKDVRFMIKSFMCAQVGYNSGPNRHAPKSKKSPESGKKQTERRKTIQILVDGESPRPQQKGPICSTKSTFFKYRSASFISNSRRSSSANKSMKPKNIPQIKAEAINTIKENLAFVPIPPDNNGTHQLAPPAPEIKDSPVPNAESAANQKYNSQNYDTHL